ncbi:MAG: histidine kinase famiy protein [Burkholderiaceae bacterium]
MATGSGKDEAGDKLRDVEGAGQSLGVPAAGELEGNAYNPLGEVGTKHWQSSFISRPGLEDRGDVFFAAIEMTRMPMVVTDPNLEDNPVVFVNKAFLDLTGYAEEQVLGRNCRFLQGPQTDPETVAEIREALSSQRAIAIDILNYKADGSSFWNALFIGPIFDQEGRLLYYFSSQMDITQRRISEQSYRQAQKMEAIGQLTAGLAHDFNNLLQVIAGNLESAAQSRGDQDAIDAAIGHAQLAVGKAGKLTQQLLAFARKQRLEPKRINLNALVVEFSEMLVRTLGDKVDLHLDLKPGLPSCTLDPTHMEMALLNVLINARDAMPKGGKVSIGTSLITDKSRIGAHRLPPGIYAVISVIDQGEGMPPEIVRRATEPFFTTKNPGTGLGLAMVHGFVQQSHGSLEIESEPGHGTTVRMIFPIAERSAMEIFAEKGPKNQDGNVPRWSPEAILEKRTVMVVDDNDDVRQLVQRFLASLGYRVIAAASGEEALEMVERYGNVDILFTDIIMPGGMNGIQLAGRMQELKPNLPVLYATGYIEEVADQGGSSSEMNILSKPYSHTELANRLRAALEKSSLQKRRSGDCEADK